MTKYIKTLSLSALFALGFLACKKDSLDPLLKTALLEKESFANPSRVASMVNGLYDALKSGNLYGSRYLIYPDIRGEEFLNETNNAVTGLQTWNHTIISNTAEVGNVWNSAYFAINSVNIFLEGLDKNKAVLNNETLASNYTAEARFVRAVCYYTLLTMYARPYADGNGSKPGVPLRLKAEKDATSNDLARSTVDEVYKQILLDLDFAEQNLPASYSTAYLNTTRAHKNTAIAFKTRVYLAMQKWDNVITEANKIVSTAAPFKAATGVAHQLQANVVNVFTTPYTTTESIFSMPMTDLDPPGTQNALALYWAPAPKGNGEFSLNPNGIIGDTSWRAGDARRTMLTTVGTKRYLNKFPTGPVQIDYAPVIRYAEVLLNLAEALARKSTGSAVDARAVALLSAVRQRSDATYTFPESVTNDAAGLIDAILRERRIELLGEGFRSTDCIRLLLPIPGKSGANGNIPTIQTSQAVYIWPIPQGEIAVNKLCLPN